MLAQQCRKCGGDLKTHTVDYVMTKYCNHCGPQPHSVKLKKPNAK